MVDRHGEQHHVSILTRSEERMQCLRPTYGREAKPCFNPHPLRRADAILLGTDISHSDLVSILTRSEERMQLDSSQVYNELADVSILTRSEERMQSVIAQERNKAMNVSILTRSEERMQLGATGHLTQ